MGLVGQHLRAYCDYTGAGDTLHHWHTKAGLEVYFVVYGPSTFAAFEIRNTARPTGHDLKALKHFRQDYPEAALFLLHRGTDTTLEDGILCLPCEKFLRHLTPGMPFSHDAVRSAIVAAR